VGAALRKLHRVQVLGSVSENETGVSCLNPEVVNHEKDEMARIVIVATL
jgi:hypothetical protein